MNNARQNWWPSKGEQRFLWWSARITNIIGVTGAAYCALVTKDTAGILVFGAFGSGVDLGTLAALLVKVATQSQIIAAEEGQTENASHEDSVSSPPSHK